MFRSPVRVDCGGVQVGRLNFNGVALRCLLVSVVSSSKCVSFRAINAVNVIRRSSAGVLLARRRQVYTIAIVAIGGNSNVASSREVRYLSDASGSTDPPVWAVVVNWRRRIRAYFLRDRDRIFQDTRGQVAAV